jgi:hypothetical protein
VRELDRAGVGGVDRAEHCGLVIFNDRRNVAQQDMFRVGSFRSFAELLRRSVQGQLDCRRVWGIENCGVDYQKIGVFGETFEIWERRCIHVAGERDALALELDTIAD